MPRYGLFKQSGHWKKGVRFSVIEAKDLKQARRIAAKMLGISATQLIPQGNLGAQWEDWYDEGRPDIYSVWVLPEENPNTSLYTAFHGSKPQLRRVRFQSPKPNETLVAIGRITQINYRPYGSSGRKGVEYTHTMGDTGSSINPEKPVLAVSQDGKRFYIIRDKARTHFSARGIIS